MLNYRKTMLAASLLALIGVWMGCSSDTSPVASYSASKSHTDDADAGTNPPDTNPPDTGSEDSGLTEGPTSPTVVAIPDTNLANAIKLALRRLPEIGTGGPEPALTATNLAKLTTLNANHRGIVNLTGLEKAVNLENLQLYRNGFTDISPLEGLTKLKVLNMYRGSIQDISPLEGLTNLGRLAIGANDFGGDLTPLAGLTNLEWLKVNDAAVTDLSPLEGLTKLVNLNLSSNGGITDTGYSPLKCLLPTLDILQLRGMHGNPRYTITAAGEKVVNKVDWPTLKFLGDNLTIIWD